MKGRTFNALNFPHKVAVDPNFRFDTQPFQKEGVEFNSITSDQYFIQKGHEEKFDIMFLDGLHTFRQIFRDFCNSLLCAMDNTVWLIDDVMPLDAYTAHPDQGQARNLRERAGLPVGVGWHGDVFKVVFAIHDFFPMLQYVTLTEKNGQLLIWKPAKPKYEPPVFNSLEAIERMTFFDLMAHENVLRLTKEQHGLSVFAETKRPNLE